MRIYNIYIKQFLEQNLNVIEYVKLFDISEDIRNAIIDYFTKRKVKIYLQLPLMEFNTPDKLPAVVIEQANENIQEYAFNLGKQLASIDFITGVYSGNYTFNNDNVIVLSGLYFNILEVYLNDNVVPFSRWDWDFDNNQTLIYLVYKYSGDYNIDVKYQKLENDYLTFYCDVNTNKSYIVYVLGDNELATAILAEVIRNLLYHFFMQQSKSFSNIIVSFTTPPAGLGNLLPANVFLYTLRVSFNVWEQISLLSSGEILYKIYSELNI